MRQMMLRNLCKRNVLALVCLRIYRETLTADILEGVDLRSVAFSTDLGTGWRARWIGPLRFIRIALYSVNLCRCEGCKGGCCRQADSGAVRAPLLLPTSCSPGREAGGTEAPCRQADRCSVCTEHVNIAYRVR